MFKFLLLFVTTLSAPVAVAQTCQYDHSDKAVKTVAHATWFMASRERLDDASSSLIWLYAEESVKAFGSCDVRQQAEYIARTLCTQIACRSEMLDDLHRKYGEQK